MIIGRGEAVQASAATLPPSRWIVNEAVGQHSDVMMPQRIPQGDVLSGSHHQL